MEWQKYNKPIEEKLKLYTKFDWILLVFVDFLYSMSAYTDELFQDESHHPPPDGCRVGKLLQGYMGPIPTCVDPIQVMKSERERVLIYGIFWKICFVGISN
jgi:hypothetical protein